MNSRRFSWSNCICRPSQGLPWQHTALARIKLGAHCSAGFDPAHDRSGSNSAFQRIFAAAIGNDRFGSALVQVFAQLGAIVGCRASVSAASLCKRGALRSGNCALHLRSTGWR